ncbi:MAG: tetratricopeptide repeat protein [Actinobacteria bacterium]|nr:tetratricopeptide repeat protein [Actinomycetota bacterium]
MSSIKKGDDEFAKGNWAEAETAYKHALEEDPENVYALIQLARALDWQRKFKVAREYCLRALSLDQSSPEARITLGSIAFRSRDYKVAEAEFRKAFESEEKSERAFIGLGEFLTYRGGYQEAIEVLSEGSKAFPESPRMATSLGLAYFRTGDYDEAYRNFKKAHEMEPSYADAVYYLGILCRKQGKLLEARDYFGNAVALQPDYYRYELALRLLEVKLEGVRTARHRFREIARDRGQSLPRRQRGLYFFLAPPLGRASYILIPLVVIVIIVSVVVRNAALVYAGCAILLIWMSFDGFWYRSKIVGAILLIAGLYGLLLFMLEILVFYYGGSTIYF